MKTYQQLNSSAWTNNKTGEKKREMYNKNTSGLLQLKRTQKTAGNQLSKKTQQSTKGR